MAFTLTVDTSNTRDAGANTEFYDGLMGTPVVFSFTNVSDGLIFNCGFGAQWVAWENVSGAPYSGGSAQTVAPTLSGDRVTMNVPGGGPFSGNLWVFYRRGRGDARASTGGTTISPSGIVESSRMAQKLRLTVWNTSTVTNNQTSQSNVSGVQRLMTRTFGSDTNALDVRFANDVNHGLGKPTVTSQGANRVAHVVFMTGGGKGLDANGL